MSEYRHLQMKKAEKPDYLPDPAEGTRSQLRYQAKRQSPRETTSETEVSLQNIKQANVSTNVPSKTYIRSNYLCIIVNKWEWGLTAEASFDPVAILNYDYK